MQLEIDSLQFWQQQVFAASLLQRMLPNYAYFSDATQFGDYNLLQNQMDIIWQKLSLMPIKFNAELQLDKLQANIPAASDFDMFAVFPAIDVCTGLVSLLESFDEKETRCGYDLSLLSLNSVRAYLELMDLELMEQELMEQESDNKSNDSLENEPLFLWELQTQQALFDLVLEIKPSKQNCLKMKSFVMQERLTNLAIEY